MGVVTKKDDLGELRVEKNILDIFGANFSHNFDILKPFCIIIGDVEDLNVAMLLEGVCMQYIGLYIGISKTREIKKEEYISFIKDFLSL